MTSSGDQGVGNGTLRLIWQFPNWRMDIDTQEGKAVFINVNNKSYLCSDEGGQGQCLTVDSGADAALPFLSTFTDPDELQDFINTTASLDVKKSDRKIAGQNARCFSFSGVVEGEQGEAEWCFAKDGLLLLLSASGQSGNFRMEAKEVSRNVSSSDFEPPFPVVDLGGLIPSPTP